jgi:hypothetical protein
VSQGPGPAAPDRDARARVLPLPMAAGGLSGEKPPLLVVLVASG